MVTHIYTTKTVYIYIFLLYYLARTKLVHGFFLYSVQCTCLVFTSANVLNTSAMYGLDSFVK